MYEVERRWNPVSLGLAIAGGLVVGGIALSAALWILGMLAGIFFFVIRLGLLVALAALVVWGVRFVFGDRRPHWN